MTGQTVKTNNEKFFVFFSGKLCLVLVIPNHCGVPPPRSSLTTPCSQMRLKLENLLFHGLLAHSTPIPHMCTHIHTPTHTHTHTHTHARTRARASPLCLPRQNWTEAERFHGFSLVMALCKIPLPWKGHSNVWKQVKCSF